MTEFVLASYPLKLYEQDRSADIEQQPPFGAADKEIHCLKGGGGG